MGLESRPFGWGEILLQEVRRKLLDFVAIDFARVKLLVKKSHHFNVPQGILNSCPIDIDR